MRKFYTQFFYFKILLFFLSISIKISAGNPLPHNNDFKAIDPIDFSSESVLLSSNMYAKDDINQIPQEIIANGNVLFNDHGVNLIVNSATHLDSNGTWQNFVLGSFTSVYDKNSRMAGTFTMNLNGNYVFEPSVNYVGALQINYTAADQNNNLASATLVIKVIPKWEENVNNRPIAHNDTGITKSGLPLSSNLLLNDSDLDNDVLTLTKANQEGIEIPIGPAFNLSGINDTGNLVPNAGKLSVLSNGNYAFVPEAGFSGKIHPITYSIKDGKGGTDKAQLFLRVIQNDGSNKTFANDDTNSAKKNATMSGNVLLNDSDPEAHTLVVKQIQIDNVNYTIPAAETGITLSIPVKGWFTIKPNGSYKFIPETDFVGTVKIEIGICDTASPTACSSSTLYLTNVEKDPLCYESILGNSFNWIYTQTAPYIERSFVLPGTEGGLIFDVYNLDNSFHMKINGVYISTEELEFENNAVVLTRNIRFADGSRWGAGGIPNVWGINGTPGRPSLRIIIDKNGYVSMFGSKASGGPLFPLELFAGTTFNVVPLNVNSNNDIIIRQNVAGYTRMRGDAYVQNIITCPCTLPGNFSGGTGLPANIGVSSLRKDNSDNWPQVREGAWIALESKTKGFVPNRLTTVQIAAIPAADLIVGMMVYNITDDCLQINTNGLKTGWKCFRAQSCGE